MARHLYLVYLPLFAQLVRPEFLNSTLACSETCLILGETPATCNTDDFFCFCQSEVFHETYICCVRSLCDSSNAASLTDAAAASCAAAGAAFTPVATSACSTIFDISGTTTATSTKSSSSATGTISQNTITTATATATQRVSGNTSSSSGSHSAPTSSSTAGSSTLYSSAGSSSSGSSTGSGLSTGARAGIGSGVGVGVLLVLVMVIMIPRRSRKRNQEVRDRDQQQPLPQDMPEPSDHGNETTPWVEYKAELDANQGHHRPPSGQSNDTAELAARGRPPAELAATLSRPWNELSANPVYYQQLPTGENTSELP